jgi:ABC-type polysaccharide/polyol phosphate transport system ATPase subunit
MGALDLLHMATVLQRPDAAAAIVVDRVSKRFRVPHERYYTLKERALHGFRRTRYEPLEGLHDVSFSVAPGEFFGVVGRNGSGKSTLLKCVAGIYRIDEGEIRATGRLSTFIELGVGFNPDLAAEDNVVLNAILLGLDPQEARRRVDSVIEFAELQEFRDMKLKNYSSGMYVRLAFAVMIQVDADILLIDEVLAVGDAAFQHKCYTEFERMREEGRTILFVTHDMQAVNRFCHRALLLERGEVIAIGDPKEVTGQYMAVNFRQERGVDATELIGELDDRAAYVADAWLESEDGERREYVAAGDPVTCKVRVNFSWGLDDPALVLAIESESGAVAFATSSAWNGRRTGRFEPGEQVVFAVSFDSFLAPGRYYISPQVALLEGRNAGVVDRRDRAAAFVVTGAGDHEPAAGAAHEFVIERIGARELPA